jgi:glycosyltransferase involved in cell wall biosynthesis
MRIGIDARLVYYTKAGIGQYILNLIPSLKEIDKRNEYIILQSRKDKSIIADAPNFRRAFLWTPCHHRFEQLALRFELSPLGLDLLHSPDFIPPFSRNFKSIITIHDLAFLIYPHFLTRESARYYSQIYRAVRSTDHIIADSESTKRDAIRLLGVPEQKITAIHLAANPIYRPIEDEEAIRLVKEKYSIGGDFILFVSTIEPRKNLPTLLRAYRMLLDDCNVKLVVVGEKGWLFDEAFTLVKELKLDEWVIFLGLVPTEDLLYIYNAAKLLVHPSLYEGFGLPPLEAMACGTPVVVSNTSSLPEVVGDSGILVDPRDVTAMASAIKRALTDEALREDLISKGLRRAKLFSWENTARKTLEIYSRVCEYD